MGKIFFVKLVNQVLLGVGSVNLYDVCLLNPKCSSEGQ
jgi:hypothetical protein